MGCEFRVVHSRAGMSAVGLQFSIKKMGVQVLHGCTVITNLRPGRHVIRKALNKNIKKSLLVLQ